MSHRDECLLGTVEDAQEWLERYRHTVGTFDPQVLRVIELLEKGRSVALEEAESRAAEAEEASDESIEALRKVIELCETFQNTDFDDLDLDDPTVAEYRTAAFQMSCDVIKAANAAL